MTLQEIFNKAYLGLKAQGFERSMANWRCAYRGAEGRKCAIGQVLPDEHYDAKLEGKSPQDEMVFKALQACGVIDPTEAIKVEVQTGQYKEGVVNTIAYELKALQGCHDNGRSSDEMQSNLRRFAASHNLTVPNE